jgi:tricorn protease
VLAILALLLLIFPARAGASTTRAIFVQYPDIQSGKIVFCYNNDIYVVPEDGGFAARLTSHIGQEAFPKLSPDGKNVAFTGQYFGGANVFVIPSEGGEPRQLTCYPDPSVVVDWTPDGSKVLYTSTRLSHSSFFQRFFTLDVKSGREEVIPVDKGSFGTFSPDGASFLFNRSSSYFWWWKRYKGSANADLWLCGLKEGTFERLTDYPGNDMWPMWGFDGYYFVSDRDGIANVYRMDPKTKEITRVTNQGNDGVSWPSIDAEGRRIIFLNDGRLLTLDLEKKEVKEVEVHLQADGHVDRVEIVTPKLDTDEMDISPSAKRVVVGMRGHIVSLPAREGVARTYTKSSLCRDQKPAWSPDGKHIAFISDRDGDQEIYMTDQLGKGSPVKLTQDGGFKEGFIWAPDGKHILYFTLDRKLCILDVEAKKTTLIDTSDAEAFSDADFSPDSKWIAYVKRSRNSYTRLNLYNLEARKIHELKLDDDFYYNPVFTKDGKGLLFLHASVMRSGMVEAAYMSLQKAKAPTVKREDDEETGRKAEAPKKEEPSKEEQPKKDAPAEVKIDLDGLESRIEYVKEMSGLISDMKAGKTLYYFMKLKIEDRPGPLMMHETALYSYSPVEREVKKVADKADGYRLAAFGEKILVASGGKLRILKAGVPAGPARADGKEAEDMVPLDLARLRIDRSEEWRQIFEESFRMVKYNFYDPDFHGVNWEKVGAYYRGFLPYIKSRQELNMLLLRMVGELNASHQGASGGDYYGESFTMPQFTVGLLGAVFGEDREKNLWRIEKIYRGDPDSPLFRAPLDRYYYDIKPGDYLLAINGEKITLDDNPYLHLWKSGRNRLSITYNTRPDFEGSKDINVDPVISERDLRYREWVETNIKTVDELSNGKVGYVHLQDMMFLGLKQFTLRFREYRYKQALLIDVRYNGGGGIDPILIDQLERQKYMTIRERYGFPEERPDNGFYGPMAVLCNEYSYSDAEVFPRAFQIRKLGKVIGTPTLGFVIAVTGHRLIDGGIIRKTFVGLWDNEGGMLESKGVQPDIVVENTPQDELKAYDRQLVTAVQYLLDEVKLNPRTFDYPVPVEPR